MSITIQYECQKVRTTDIVTTSDNGILARITGDHIARALQMLPPANSASPETAEIEIDVPGTGRVLFTAERVKSKKGKSVHYFWSASKAVLVIPTSPSTS